MSSAPTSRTGMPVAMILGSCVSLQFGAAFAAQLFGSLGSWGVTCLRLGIAAIVLLAIVRPAVHRWDGAQWRAVVLFGVALGAMNGSFYSAIERIPLGAAVAIEFLGPLVLSAVLSRRAADLACVGVALVGVSLFGVESLVGIASLDPLGVVFALTAGVFWACYILTSAQVGQVVPGHGGLAVAVAIGAVALLPLGAGGVARAVVEPHLLLLALGCSLLASVIPYVLELSALRRLPRHVFGILLSLEPAVAALAGLALLGQPITVLGVLAVVLVIAASVGTTLTARREARRPVMAPEASAVGPDGEDMGRGEDEDMGRGEDADTGRGEDAIMTAGSGEAPAPEARESRDDARVSCGATARAGG